MSVAKVYQGGQWVALADGSSDLVTHKTLYQELSRKSDIGHNHGPVGQVPGGFQQLATTFVYPGGDVQVLSGFTIAGDGVTPVKIIVGMSYVEVAAGTGAHFYLRRDGVNIQTFAKSGNGGAIPGGYPWDSLHTECVVAPFTGTKSFTVNVATSSGAGLTVHAISESAHYQAYIRAEWAPGHTVNI